MKSIGPVAIQSYFQEFIATPQTINFTYNIAAPKTIVFTQFVLLRNTVEISE